MTYRYREEKGFIASVVIDNNTPLPDASSGRCMSANFRTVIPASCCKTLYPDCAQAILGANP